MSIAPTPLLIPPPPGGGGSSTDSLQSGSDAGMGAILGKDLEQLIKLKDSKIATLQAKLQQAEQRFPLDSRNQFGPFGHGAPGGGTPSGPWGPGNFNFSMLPSGPPPELGAALPKRPPPVPNKPLEGRKGGSHGGLIWWIFEICG